MRRSAASAGALVAPLAASLAIGLAGCSTPVLKPAVEVPAQFAAAPASETEPEVAWWESYGDPVLSDLIRRAARENRDVRIAAARVRAARAGETISRSWLLPSISAVGGGTSRRHGYDAAKRQALPDTDIGGGGLDVSWEIDLSGRLRAGATAADADALAVENGARGVRLLVLTDVASNYFTLVGALRQLETVRAISAAQDETLRLVTARQRAGLATPFDVERAQTEASRARARDPAARDARRRLAPPHRRADRRPGVQRREHHAVERRGGRPAGARRASPPRCCERRPDLLAAKAQLDAANARRQQANAEWFPRLFLGALFGRGSADIERLQPRRGALHERRRRCWRCRSSTPGARRRSTRSPRAGQREAVLRYEDAIVRALEDVENALVALSTTSASAPTTLQSAAASADAALGRAQSLYDRGQIDLLPLLDAQRTRLAVRVGANDSQHAAAARQRAAVQGARRRLASVRARSRPAQRHAASSPNS